MGRSVSYPRDAVVTFAQRQFEDEFDFDFMLDDYCYRVRKVFPSAERTEYWLSNEDHAVMENRHAYFGVSEYCGMVSFWMVSKADIGYGNDHPALSDHWVAQMANKFIGEFGELAKVGTFSNGGCVYRPINDHDPGPDNFNDHPAVINGMVCDG